MKRPLSPRMQAAWDQTKAAYKALIRAPRRELPKWEHYGHGCRFCKVAGYWRGRARCKICILGPEQRGCVNGDMYDSFIRLARNLPRPISLAALRSAARARLKALTAKIEDNP